MPHQRVVLDTNVVLSALLFRQGSLVWFRSAWQSSAIRPLASPATLAELTRVLAYPKFKLADADRERLASEYLPWCEAVPVPTSTPVPDCRDPRDRPFLMLARAGHADALVTGDKDLLALAKGFSVPILEPAAFRERVQESP